MDTKIYADTKRENDKYTIFYADAKSCRTKKKIFSEQQEQKHIIFVFLKQDTDWKN